MSLIVIISIFITSLSSVSFASDTELGNIITDNEQIKVVETDLGNGMVARSTYNKSTKILNTQIIKRKSFLKSVFSSKSANGTIIDSRTIELDKKNQSEGIQLRSGSFYNVESNSNYIAGYSKYYYRNNLTFYKLTFWGEELKTPNINTDSTLKSWCTNYKYYVDNMINSINSMALNIHYHNPSVDTNEAEELLTSFLHEVNNMTNMSTTQKSQVVINMLQATVSFSFAASNIVTSIVNEINCKDQFARIKSRIDRLYQDPSIDWPIDFQYA